MSLPLILSGFADEAAFDLAGQLQSLRVNHLLAVDLRTVDDINVADFSPEKARVVRDALSEAGVSVACLASPIGKIDITAPFEPHLDKLKRLCETGQILNCLKMRIFSFYIPKGQPAGDYRSAVLERMDRLLLVAADAGVRLLHENEKDIYGDTAERCLDLHQNFNRRLGGILDPANYLQVGSDPLAAMRSLDPWIEYLHIKDVRLSDMKVVPAGQGDGRVREILVLYTARPDRRNVAVEPHLFTFSGLARLERELVSQPAAGITGATGATGSAGAAGAVSSSVDGSIIADARAQALAAFSTAVSACRALLE